MALDALRCNHLAPLGFKGLIQAVAENAPIAPVQLRGAKTVTSIGIKTSVDWSVCNAVRPAASSRLQTNVANPPEQHVSIYIGLITAKNSYRSDLRWHVIGVLE